MDLRDPVFKTVREIKFNVTGEDGIPYECIDMSEVVLSIIDIMDEADGEPVDINIETL